MSGGRRQPGIRREVSPQEALVRLEALCAGAERCTFELRRKLTLWRINDADAERIVASLVKRRFVDDGRFARAFARDKMRFSRWGTSKIRAALSARAINSDDIAAALDEAIGEQEEDYAAGLLRLLRAKVRSRNLPRDYDSRMRLMRFAVGRGFEASLVSRIISSGTPWEEEEDSEE